MKMNNRGFIDIFFIGFLAIIVSLCGVSFTKHNTGVTESYRVKGFSCDPMYGSASLLPTWGLSSRIDPRTGHRMEAKRAATNDPGLYRTDKETGFWKMPNVQAKAYAMAKNRFPNAHVKMVDDQAYLYMEGKWWSLATDATADYLMRVDPVKL